MIAKILPVRCNCRHTIKYAFGQTESKRDSRPEEAYFLASNGLTTIDPTVTTEEQADGGLAIVRIPSNEANLDPIIDEFERHAARNSRAFLPYWHSVLSISPEDEPSQTDESLRQIARDYMVRMGYEYCPWVATIHRDTDHTHIHLAACTVQSLPGYPVVDRYKDFEKAMDACRKIETKYGLKAVPMPEDARDRNDTSPRHVINDIRLILDWALLNELESSQTPDLCRYLAGVQECGIDVNIRWRQGAPAGVSYSFKGCSFTATKLGGGGRYQLRHLQNFLAYDNGRQHDKLEEIHQSNPTEENTENALLQLPGFIQLNLNNAKSKHDRRGYIALEFNSMDTARRIAAHPQTPVAHLHQWVRRKDKTVHILYYRQSLFIPATTREEVEFRKLLEAMVKLVRSTLNWIGITAEQEPLGGHISKHPGMNPAVRTLPVPSHKTCTPNLD